MHDPKPRRAVASLAAVLAAVFLGALDQTVIVATLPAIVVDLQIPFDKIDQAAWIVSGYLLGYTVALPLMGRFADLRGRRRAFVISLAAFAFGSLGCALAPSLATLIVARLIQAAGGGALLPVAIAVVTDRYPPRRRAFFIGAIGAVAEAGGVLGPLYGATIVQWLTWRWIFWINVPVALILLVVCWSGLVDRALPKGRLDLVGALLVTVALGSLILGFSHEPLGLLGVDARPVLLALAGITFPGFIAWERRTDDPLLDLALFRRGSFGAAVAGGILLGGALIVAMVDVPLFANTVLGASAAEGGLLLMRLTALIPVGALLGGLLGQRVGLAAPTGLGFTLAAIGLYEMSRWGIAPGPGLLWESLALGGSGFGMLIAPLATAAVNASPPDRQASAAAMFSVSRLSGMTVALSILTTWGLQRFEDLASGIPLPLPRPGDSAVQAAARVAAYQQSITLAGAETYHEIFLAAAAISLTGLLAAAFLLRPASGKYADE